MMDLNAFDMLVEYWWIFFFSILMTYFKTSELLSPSILPHFIFFTNLIACNRFAFLMWFIYDTLWYKSYVANKSCIICGAFVSASTHIWRKSCWLTATFNHFSSCQVALLLLIKIWNGRNRKGIKFLNKMGGKKNKNRPQTSTERSWSFQFLVNRYLGSTPQGGGLAKSWTSCTWSLCHVFRLTRRDKTSRGTINK